MRINKFLASCGIASRRKVEDLIKQGKVKVNGTVVFDLSTSINESDEVLVNNKKVQLNDNKIYIVLNKPKNVLTSVSDDRGRKTVIDIIPKNFGRIFPVGRLDYNTEGLLILTNDGDFSNLIMHPKKEINKTYEITTFDIINEDIKNKLENGVDIGDFVTSKAKVTNIQQKQKPYKFNISIHEGKNRQVRRMCAAVGIHVQGLKRLSIGKLTLDGLNVGEYKLLTQDEILNKIGVKNENSN